MTFRLENGSFLPPGLHLDGFGVISGTTDVDLSKLNVKICAIQLGGYGSNFNCQGQPVGFGKEVVLGNTPAPPPAAAATGGGGGITALVTGLGLAAAGALGYAAYKGASCGPIPIGASFNACLAGNCFSCVTVAEELTTWCECAEEKGLSDPGFGANCREQLSEIRRRANECLVPPSSTPLPVRAPRR